MPYWMAKPDVTMTVKEKAELAAQEEEEAKAESDSQDATEESQETEEATNIENKIDYEAELEKERKRAANAERALAEKRFIVSKKKREGIEEEEQDDENKPLTKAELRELLAEERQATQKVVQESRIREIAKGLASSDVEAELIVELHKGITFPSHYSLEDQLESVHAIANRKRLHGENNELKRALKSKDGVKTDVATTYHDAPKGLGGEPKVPATRKLVLQEQGFKWNTESKRYEKKLPGGKFLVHDLKTGRNFRE